MSSPSFALTAVEQKQATNPLGLVRIDHIQLTGSIQKLEGLYRRLGFARVASGTVPGGRCVHLKQQRMDILVFECDEAHPAGRYFKALEGVEQVEQLADGHTLRLAVSGELDGVIKAAALHPVINLTSHEPSLEDIFLRYYQGDGQAVKEDSHVVH